MSEFTFLTKEQCLGDDQLELFKKRGMAAKFTDFSMVLGGGVDDVDEYYYGDGIPSTVDCTGCYWTRGPFGLAVHVVGSEFAMIPIEARSVGARMVLPIKSVHKVPNNGAGVDMADDNFLQVEYGYYPQSAVSKSMQKVLENAYKEGEMRKTKNTYTTDSVRVRELVSDDVTFHPQVHQEYEYKGKRYVRVSANIFKGPKDNKHVILSNGQEVHLGDNVWIEVEPVKWSIDDKSNLMVTDKIIFSGINFGIKAEKSPTFEDTHIKKFIDEYFAKELVQEIGKFKSKYIEESEEENGERKTRLQKLNPDTTKRRSRSKMTDTEIIGNWIEAGESVLLRGPSGIGKTERIKSLYPDLIYMKLTNNMFPEKVVGSVNLQTGESIPPDFAKTAIMQEATEEEKKLIEENIQNIYEIADKVYERSKESDKKVVIMLDELLNVKPAVQSLVYTLVLNRMVEIGKGLKLPDNVVVVATGNQKRYSRVAEDLAEPLEKRFDHILDMEPKVGEWITEYAIPRKIHPTVIGYMMSKYASSMKSEAKEDIGYFYEEPEVGEEHLDENGCKGRTNDPRGWASISQMLYNFERNLEEGKYVGKNVEDILRRTIGSKLREEWAAEFYDYYNLPTLSPEEVVEKKYNQGDLPQDMNEKFAYMTALIGAKENEVEACRRFIKKHCDAECLAIYDIYWAGEDERRQEKISELENMQKHKKEEAEEFGKEGVKVYNEIGKLYKKFLAKSKDKGEENERI